MCNIEVFFCFEYIEQRLNHDCFSVRNFFHSYLPVLKSLQFSFLLRLIVYSYACFLLSTAVGPTYMYYICM